MNVNLPTIAIVTPSFNSVQYIEETILSVLAQKYDRLEYVVVDGCSTDGTVDCIRKYERDLVWWVSEPDGGQYDAVNKGFRHTSAEIMGWLNSDDKHTPWTLSVVGEIFASFPEVQWISTTYPLHWDRYGRAVRSFHFDGFSREAFWGGNYLPGWGSEGWIQQESTFWRRSLWDAAGSSLDTRWSLAADFDLWTRFFAHAALCGVDVPLAGFRVHGDQKTARQYEQYVSEANQIFKLQGGRSYGSLQRFVRWKLRLALPGKARELAGRAGIFPSREICTYSDWTLGWTRKTVW